MGDTTLEQQIRALFSSKHPPTRDAVLSLCPGLNRFTPCQFEQMVHHHFAGCCLVSAKEPERELKPCVLPANKCYHKDHYPTESLNCLSHTLWLYAWDPLSGLYSLSHVYWDAGSAFDDGNRAFEVDGMAPLLAAEPMSLADLERGLAVLLEDFAPCSDHKVAGQCCNKERGQRQPKLDAEEPIKYVHRRADVFDVRACPWCLAK